MTLNKTVISHEVTKQTLFVLSDLSPFVSIILPIRNEAQYIERCLTSIVMQDYPSKNMEILIADGMSTDSTRSIVNKISEKYIDHNIVLLDNPGLFYSNGFNSAVCLSRGGVYLMMGGHTELAQDYISRVVGYLKSSAVDCVGGVLETVADDTIGKAIAVGMSSPFGVGGVAFRTSSPLRLQEVDTVAFGAYKRDTVNKNNLLDEEMVHNQDDEFNYRLRSLGRRLYLAPDLHLKYYCRVSFSALWQQYYQYGYWKVRVLQKHPFQMRLRQFVPPFFVLSLIASVFLAFAFIVFSNVSLGFLSIVFPLLYLIANLFASFLTASKRGWQFLPYLPFIYSALHLSYGFGFLVGFLKFLNGWFSKSDQFLDCDKL